MTAGILRRCNKKEKICKAFKKATCSKVSKNTKKIRNQLNKILKVAEKDYYSAGFKMSATNIRENFADFKRYSEQWQ